MGHMRILWGDLCWVASAANWQIFDFQQLGLNLCGRLNWLDAHLKPLQAL